MSKSILYRWTGMFASIALATLVRCAKETETTKTEPKKESTGTAEKPEKRAIPEGQFSLPEYYGSYAIDSGRTIELKAEGPVDLSPKAEFILFHKIIAGGYGVESISIVRRLFDPWEDRWNSVPLEARLKPVQGNPEMVRVVPINDFAPGVYVLQADRWRPFYVEAPAYKKSLADNARSALANNDPRAAVQHASTLSELLDNPDMWYHRDGELAPFTHSLFPEPEARNLRQEALFAFHIMEARKSIAAKRWDAATTHTDSARQAVSNFITITPNDNRASELLDTLRTIQREIPTEQPSTRP
jgi:hypothetical protein